MQDVLILIADDWSPIAGCYGNTVIRTPNIDAMAKEGTVYDQAFCTSPSCAVSRASLLTGLYSHTHGQYGHCHGVHGFRTHDHIRSLPAVLNDSGYHTGCIGKAHFEPRKVYPFHLHGSIDKVAYPDAGWSRTSIVNQTQLFIDGSANQPFFLMVAPIYPHRSGPGAEYMLNDYKDEFQDEAYGTDEVIVPAFLPDTLEVRRDLANYYSAISRWDQCVGSVLSVLRESGRYDSTLIVVLTDHAMPFPGAKASSFDSGHRCPLIVRRPAATARGIRSHAMVNWCDIAPTVYDWCGVGADQVPEHLPGRSFLGVTDVSAPPGWDETFFSHCFHEVTNYFPYRVLHRRRYKYIRNFAHGLSQPIPSDLFRSMTWEAIRKNKLEMMGDRPTRRFLQHDREALFDLEADPLETTNLADDPALEATLQEMRQEVLDFMQRTSDPWLEVAFQEGDPVDDPA